MWCCFMSSVGRCMCARMGQQRFVFASPHAIEPMSNNDKMLEWQPLTAPRAARTVRPVCEPCVRSPLVCDGDRHTKSRKVDTARCITPKAGAPSIAFALLLRPRATAMAQLLLRTPLLVALVAFSLATTLSHAAPMPFEVTCSRDGHVAVSICDMDVDKYKEVRGKPLPHKLRDRRPL